MHSRLFATPAVIGLTAVAVFGFYEKGAQDLLSFTSGVHGKALWVRTSQCQPEDYSANSVLVAMDTREGGARVLDNTVGVHIWPIITRDGMYVIWNANTGQGEFNPANSSWIIKWDGTGKKRLIDGSVAGNPGHVLSVQWDAAARQQYVYAIRPGGSANHQVYRIPLNGDVVDLTKKTLVYSLSQITPFFTVSSNTRWAAVACPWPAVGRYDMVSKQIQASWGTMDSWACMPYIAPDSSGWLSHVDDTHTKIETIALNNTTRTWINATQGMPGNRGKYDLLSPRWSNHPQFLSCMYPLLECDVNVQKGEFCVGKFNAGYSAITWICITDTAQTTTYREGLGDVWLENGEGPGAGTGSIVSEVGPARSTSRAMTVRSSADGLRIGVSAAGVFTAEIVGLSGRVIGSTRGNGASPASLSIAGLQPGVMLAVVKTGAGRQCRAVVVK